MEKCATSIRLKNPRIVLYKNNRTDTSKATVDPDTGLSSVKLRGCLMPRVHRVEQVFKQYGSRLRFGYHLVLRMFAVGGRLLSCKSFSLESIWVLCTSISLKIPMQYSFVEKD